MMKWSRYHVLAAVGTIAFVSYIWYLRTPAFDWGAPTVKVAAVLPTQPFNVYFSVRSRENCPVHITRYAEYTAANGGLVQLPALLTEQKVIKAQPGVRGSFFTVAFPAGTEPRKYRIFSRILINNCTWLDRLWPRITDTDSAEVTVLP